VHLTEEKEDVTRDFAGEYVGIPMGTNHRDYQIHLDEKKHWLTTAGIRSTRLTASLGIGNCGM
jgi:glycerol-3-phosphate dehydrogenase